MIYRIALGVALAVAGGLVPMDANAQTAPALAGVYRLVEIDAGPLPAFIEQEGNCREELISASLVLLAEGEWSLVSTDRESCGERVEEEEETEEGTFTLQGSTITFLDEDGDLPRDRTPAPGQPRGDLDIEELATGTLAGDLLTVRLEDGVVAVFRK